MHWKEILRTNFTSLDKLADYLELDIEKREFLLSDTPFSLNLPLRLAQKMQKNSLCDPLFLQFVPTKEELKEAPGFSQDPLMESEFKKAGKLLHKYEGRALLLPTSSCAMHCRFCFRRHFPYEKSGLDLQQEMSYIQKNTELKEVILSGGDPLSLSDRVLGELIASMPPHIERIRFHTRFPIGIPERIDEAFIDLLQRVRKQLFFVIHTNHPRELDGEVLTSLQRLQKLGIPILTHTVLLKGVNDNLATLKELFELLTRHGILPYYLNQMDSVQNASHFHVEEHTGLKLMEGLHASLSGYGVPKYVREMPYEKGKSSVSTSSPQSSNLRSQDPVLKS